MFPNWMKFSLDAARLGYEVQTVMTLRMSASDVYQMLAYARRYEVDEVVLIYPAQRGLTPNEVLSFQTELDHIRLHAFGLDLVDPQSVGSALIQYLRKVGTQPLQLSA